MNKWVMNKWINEWIKKRTNEQMDNWTNEQTNKRINEQMNKRINKQINKWTYEQKKMKNGSLYDPTPVLSYCTVLLTIKVS